MKYILTSLVVAAAAVTGVSASTTPTAHTQAIDMHSVAYLTSMTHFQNNAYDPEFIQQFEVDSQRVKDTMRARFPGDENRIKNFNDAYGYGVELFSRDGGAPSRNVAAVYMAYSNLLSSDTMQTVRKKMYTDAHGDSQIDREGTPVDFSQFPNVLECSGVTCSDDDYPYTQEHQLIQSVFYHTIVSNTGILDIDQINHYFSYGIGVMGLPLNALSNFDASVNQECNDFWSHDHGHTGEIMEFFIYQTQQGIQTVKGLDYTHERRAIYQNMVDQNLNQHFAIPYFLTFHEYGRVQAHDNNPITAAVGFVKRNYPASRDIQESVITAILEARYYSPVRIEDSPFCMTWDPSSTVTITDRDQINKASIRWCEPYRPTLEDACSFVFSLHESDTLYAVGRDASYNEIFPIMRDLGMELQKEYPDLDVREESFDHKRVYDILISRMTAFHDRYGYLFDKYKSR